MKNLLTVILLVTIHFGVLAQKEVFRIDSIPQQGILLDKGWKWHAGDNPDFAKPDFDDSKWESIDPTLSILDLPQIQKANIGWFRFHINIDSSLTSEGLALLVWHLGASEFFLNGKQFYQFGEINGKPLKVIAYQPWGKGIMLPVKRGGEQILAIRFADQKDIPYALYAGTSEQNNSTLKLWICRVNTIENNTQKIHNEISQLLSIFKCGIFAILVIVHLAFYFYYQKLKANLFFGVYAFCSSLSFGASFINSSGAHHLKFFYLSEMALFMTTLSILSVVEAIYWLFKEKKGWLYTIVVFFGVIALLVIVSLFKWGILATTYFSFFGTLEVIRVSVKAAIGRKRGVTIISLGVFCFLLFFFSFLFYFSKLGFDSKWIVFGRYLSYNIGVLSLPIAISLYLAREFAFTSKDLGKKLDEVQKLSSEKQETLQKQNTELQTALLKGQTIERQRVALDLHDNLGSTLSALWLSLDSVNQTNMNLEEKAIHQNLRANLEKAYNDVRLLSHNLLPEEFEKQGLKTILQGFVRKMNKNSTIKFDLKIDEDFGRVDNKIEFELYSICLELVNNIIKHSKATEAKIELLAPRHPMGELKLIVSDNGIGVFKNDSDGKGMKNVKARVESLNGKWELINIENQGVTNTITVHC
jgi:signal transduction histidine kinase